MVACIVTRKCYYFALLLSVNYLLHSPITASDLSLIDANSLNSKSLKKVWSINEKCLENSECWLGSDNNRVCVDGRCQCDPNYHFDYINNQCKYFTCRLDKDCQSHDEHRYCDAYDNCKCENGYGQQFVTKKCVPLRLMGSPCLADSDCWTLSDSHRVCRANECHCKMLYKYDHYEHKCVAKTACDKDKDCKKYDLNRVCDGYGLCACKSGYYANSIKDKCKKVASLTFRDTYSNNLSD